MKVEEKAEQHSREAWGIHFDEKLPDPAIKFTVGEISISDFIAGYNYATQPTTTETLQEGDWTKCDKFSEWISLLEIEGMKYFNSIDDFTLYQKHKGELKSTKEPMLLWGKGENFLPYQEFKQRAENTFKNK